jgi:hypothetical protein
MMTAGYFPRSRLELAAQAGTPHYRSVSSVLPNGASGGYPRMLIQSIHFTFAPEDADRAASFLRELREESRKEDGVLRFDVCRSKEKPNVFALWEEYRTVFPIR